MRITTRGAARGIICGLLLIYVLAGNAEGLADGRPFLSSQREIGRCSPAIPSQDCSAAIVTYEFVMTHNFSPPPNVAGGKIYQNFTGLLPPDGDYLEFDLYPRPANGGRAPQRLVVDRANPEGNSWFSADHYQNFIQFYVLA